MSDLFLRHKKDDIYEVFHIEDRMTQLHCLGEIAMTKPCEHCDDTRKQTWWRSTTHPVTPDDMKAALDDIWSILNEH